MFLSIKEYNTIKECASKFDFYALSRGDTKVDRWCAKFWDPIGVKKKTGIDCAAISDLLIYKDIVIEVFYPTEIKKEINHAYEKVKKIEDLNIPNFFEKVFQKKIEITVIIHNNKNLVEQLKDLTISYFK